MTIRAHVQENFAWGTTDIWIVDVGSGTRSVLRNDGAWQAVGEGVQIDPSLRLHEDAGRALLEALVRYYNGAEDTRSLRKDYDAERIRVDRLTTAVIDIATSSKGASNRGD